IHLARLTELEYLLIHRGGRGQSFEYELLYDGAAHGNTPHISGLIDVEALRHDYDPERSGSSTLSSRSTLSLRNRGSTASPGRAERPSCTGRSSPRCESCAHLGDGCL